MEAEKLEMDDSLKDLAEAWDTHEGEEDDSLIQSAGSDSGGVDEEQSRDDGPEGEDADSPDSGVVSESEQEAGQQTDADATEKPPVSWNAQAREQWKDIPKETRDYILQREHQMQVGMQKNAEAAQRARGMDETLRPYGQLFAMNGGPGQMLPNLLQTASLLQMGTPAQKAEMVKNIIGQFGVDIQTLDNLLVGQAPAPEVQQASAVQQAVAQAVQPYQQFMEQQRAAAAQAQQREQMAVQSDVEQFANDPANEFYKDVSADMADILDLAANRGVPMTMKEAYDRACNLHPQVGPIVAARQSQGVVSQKRQAAASISGTPSGTAASEGGGRSRLDDLMDAWDNAGRT